MYSKQELEKKIGEVKDTESIPEKTLKRKAVEPMGTIKKKSKQEEKDEAKSRKREK